jgi:predicted nucleotidyltransferase
MNLEGQRPQSANTKLKTGTLAPEVLDEIVQRIVKVAAPEKIILFGSTSRGELGPNSDVDLLVVKSGAHRRQLTQAIYMNLLKFRYKDYVKIFRPYLGDNRLWDTKYGHQNLT